MVTLSRQISSTKQLPIKAVPILTQKVIRSSTLLTVTNIKIVHQTPDGRLYYNVRNGKRFSVVHVNKENSFISEQYYRQNKSKPFLKSLISKIKCHTNNLHCPYIGFFYSFGNRNCDMQLKSYRMGIRKRKMQTRIYASRKKRMDQDRALLTEGHPVQYVYDNLLDESASPLKSKF